MIANRVEWTPAVAYFSMEIGIDPAMPTYSGGLGLLAGDTLKAAADLGLPVVAVTLLYRKGYFRQHLDAFGNQTESPYQWAPENHLKVLAPKITVVLEGRPVAVRAWQYDVRGLGRHPVPVYFLDTDLEENSEQDRNLSGSLYGGDRKFRLCQEAILGMGGVAMLRALGHRSVGIFHMNEGHSALLTLALLEERAVDGGGAMSEEDRDAVREQCVFTTHTPVAAGHDQFPQDLVVQVLGAERWKALEESGGCQPGVLNMTNLALTSSRYVNGVAMRHGEISRGLFPNYPIQSITNGVHAVTWVSPSFAALYDRYIPNWRSDNLYLRHAIQIPLEEIHEAHEQAKHRLIVEVEKRAAIALDPKALTLGFARRATAYKRANLLFANPDRLKEIVRRSGPLQVIYGGKAHPHDDPGKELIREIFRAAAHLGSLVKVVYLEEYDMALAGEMVAGVDIWLNTPQKPQEASGTSGMKAAMNGVPSLSILDGWWIEGHIEGVTGWSIGNHWQAPESHAVETDSLYDKLEKVILPLYYREPREFDLVRQSVIAMNGGFFHAQRMMMQYVRDAYAIF